MQKQGSFTNLFTVVHDTDFTIGEARGFIATSTISEEVVFTLHGGGTVTWPAVPAGNYNLVCTKIAADTEANSAKFVVYN
jgi:hypothetical protein